MTNKLVNITKAFTLTIIRDGEEVLIKVGAGIQRVEQDIADHWYTKAHSAEVPEGVAAPEPEPEASPNTLSLKK